VLEEDEKTGRRKWRQVRKRNDYLDLRTYHLALLRLHLRNTTLPTRPTDAGWP
jgi:phage terminase large subunit GpA-like protein